MAQTFKELSVVACACHLNMQEAEERLQVLSQCGLHSELFLYQPGFHKETLYKTQT